MFSRTFVVLVSLVSASAWAAGPVPTVECSADISLKQVLSTHFSPKGAFVLRNGQPSPAHASAQFAVAVDSLSAGCDVVKQKYGIDLGAMALKGSISVTPVSAAQTVKAAAALVGKKGTVVVKQSFMYQAADGSFPFFPLLHGESLNLQSSLLSLEGEWLAVDTQKAFGIPLPQYLSEDSKIALTDQIFALFAVGVDKQLMMQAVYPLIQAHPTWEKHFAEFLPKLLALYSSVKGETYIASGLASGINHLSHLFPETYAFDMVSVLTANPSLLAVNGGFQAFEGCPRLNAIQLEQVVDKVAGQYGGLNAAAKAEWSPVLKQIAGAGWTSSSCVENITSSHAKQVAQSLLQ